MAATRRQSIRAALAAACALAGVSGRGVAATELDSAVLLYSEPERITVVESVLRARREIGEARFVELKFVYDALTGASPNGALPSRLYQTFTRPSGNGGYTVAPGKTPLDESFRDARYAGSAGYELPLTRSSKGVFGANVSGESDYLSIGASAVLSRDFDRRNRTLSLGFSGSYDNVRPHGGVPLAFSSMAPPDDDGGDDDRFEDGEDDGGGAGSSDSKTVADVLLGLTQVIDRATIVQLNYSYSRSTGYQNDPYKLISVLAGGSGADQGDPVDYLYEKRPDLRVKQSLYGKIVRHFDAGILDLAYRYLWDDWGLRSHTAEMRFRRDIGESHSLEPHLRWYRQSAADFFRYSLAAGQPLPDFASADLRLAAFTTTTAGLKYGYRLANGHALSARVEYYLKRGDSSPPEAAGALRDYDLFPTVGAAVVQFEYSLEW